MTTVPRATSGQVSTLDTRSVCRGDGGERAGASGASLERLSLKGLLDRALPVPCGRAGRSGAVEETPEADRLFIVFQATLKSLVSFFSVRVFVLRSTYVCK